MWQPLLPEFLRNLFQPSPKWCKPRWLVSHGLRLHRSCLQPPRGLQPARLRQCGQPRPVWFRGRLLCPLQSLHRRPRPLQPPAQRMPDGVEEYMIHRVMQRVDVVLDQRLRGRSPRWCKSKPDRCFRACAKKSNRWCATRVRSRCRRAGIGSKVTWRNGNRVIPCGFALHLIVFPNELACKLRYVSLR